MYNLNNMIMDKIKVYRVASTSGKSSPKGSLDNPYTVEEYEEYLDSGKDWPGGYVKDMGYVAADTIIVGSYPSDDSWWDSWEDSSWSDPWGGSSSSEESSGSSSPSNGSGSNAGNHGSTGGNTEETGWPSIGNLGGNNQSGSGGTSSQGVADVLSKNQFETMQKSNDCLETCKRMLRNVNCELNGLEMLLMNHDANGIATSPTSDFAKGVSYVESQLKQGKPVVVAVDYKKGTSLKEFPNRTDQAADHFVVIVGGCLAAGFHYFDPATHNVDRGTSTNNRFTLEGGVLKSTNVCTGSTKYYTLTSVRKNK